MKPYLAKLKKKLKNIKFKKPKLKDFDYRTKSNQELKEITKKNFIIFTGISIFCVFSMIFFGPQIAKVFGYLSKYRNIVEAPQTFAPLPPIFNNAPKATKKTSIELKGATTPGALVKVYVNGPIADETVADNDGNFTFLELPIIKGRNTIFARAINDTQEESEKSETIIVEYDNKEPELELNIEDGDEIRNLNDRIIIKGESNEQAKIKINNKNVILKPDLTFEFILGAKEGENEIKLEAIDNAGNKLEEELKITYKKGS
jgi:hypothetical protein